MRVLTMISSLVGSIGLILHILHIMKVPNNLHDLAMISFLFCIIIFAYPFSAWGTRVILAKDLIFLSNTEHTLVTHIYFA